MTNGCDWNKKICVNAAKNGHIEVLKWNIDNGCNYNITIFREIVNTLLESQINELVLIDTLTWLSNKYLEKINK
jgi:hypothetical protein